MIRIVMECGHLQYFKYAPPTKGEVILCRGCGEYEKVKEAPSAHRLRCRHCTFGHSGAKDGLITAASKHVMKRPTHVVEIYDGQVLLDTITQDPNQGTLPFDQRLRERQESNRSHQSGLRQIFLDQLP